MKSLMLVPLLLSASLSHADKAAMSDYEKWRSGQLQEFRTYLEENDKAFIGFLKQRWEEVDTLPGTQEDPSPKPVHIPEAPSVPDADKPSDTPVITITPPAPVEPPVTAPPVRPVSGKATRLNFYGHRLSLPYVETMQTAFRKRPSPEGIAEGWETLAGSDYRPTTQQLEQWRESLRLSDWATARLVSDFASATAPEQDSQTLLSWFLLVKLGYDARLAYNNHLHLLLPADDDVFGVTFFTLAGKRYYNLPVSQRAPVSGKLFTYNGQHETATTAVRFRVPEHFVASGPQSERTLTFNQNGTPVTLSYHYPQAQIDYLNSLPQLALPRYPVLELPAETRSAVIQQLIPLVQGKDEVQAVNLLLNFVQNAFEYKTDEQQFREENYLFPLETLHYAASDCEDRAALFSQLVHDLLGLPVVLLDYPGHVAAAVAFSKEVNGDSLMYNARRYTVTDPTYINASAGMTMPEYAQTTPQIIGLFD